MGYAAKLGGSSNKSQQYYKDMIYSPIVNCASQFMYVIPTGGNAGVFTSIFEVSDVSKIHYRFSGSGNVTYYNFENPTVLQSTIIVTQTPRYPNITEGDLDISFCNYLQIGFVGIGGPKTLYIEIFDYI